MLKRNQYKKSPNKNLFPPKNHNQRRNKKNKLKSQPHKNKTQNQSNNLKSKFPQSKLNKMRIKIKYQVDKNQNNLSQPFSFSNRIKKKMLRRFIPTQVLQIFLKWWVKSGEDYNNTKKPHMLQKLKSSRKNMKRIWNNIMKNILNKNPKSNSKRKKLNKKRKKKSKKSQPQLLQFQSNQESLSSLRKIPKAFEPIIMIHASLYD